MTKQAASLTIDDCRELVVLRTKASKLFVVLLWLHVPVVLVMAAQNRIDWIPQAAILAGILIAPTYYGLTRPASLVTRNLVALALTAMPIFFVFNNAGRLQIDYHMYFFVVFAMLIAFCDWRPIVLAAGLTSVHHLILNFVARDRVFPTEGGVGRVALHAIMVGVECGVLVWAVAQLQKLFMTAERTQELAAANVELEVSKQRTEHATLAMIEGLERVALTDSLTQLGNHRAFSDDFAREIARAQRHGHPLTLALVDIDEFKLLNDKNGHKAGDECLVRLARLFQTLRREDRSYRVGGDEFALIFVDTLGKTARIALDRLQNEARSVLGATLSIGYVGLGAVQLAGDPYELADAALYEAKRRGRNNVVCANEIDGKATIDSPRTAAAFKRLIGEELLDIAFQPIWDIATCRPLGFEALARPHVELGLKGPVALFETAERLKMVLELDQCCIQKAFAACSKLPTGSTVFVKITPASLEHPKFNAHELVAMARAAGLVPKQIVMEIAKIRKSSSPLLIARAEALNALGVRLALGNVSSDTSGLELLTKSRIAYVKIDQSIVKKAITDEAARGVLSGIVALARSAASYVIAEGIENADLLEFACQDLKRGIGTAEGIRGVQGYLLGRPSVGALDVADIHIWSKFLSAHFIKVAS